MNVGGADAASLGGVAGYPRRWTTKKGDRLKDWDLTIEEAINILGTTFDTHRVIQEVAHRNQRKYIVALGRRIKIVCKRLSFTNKDSRSPDMFGQNSKCLTWSR